MTQHDTGDVVGTAQTAERRQRGQLGLLFGRRAVQERGGGGGARRDGVDRDVTASQLLGQNAGKDVDSRFGRRVGTQLWWRYQHHARRHVDDRAAVANPPRGLLVERESSPHVDAVNRVELSQVKIDKGGRAVDPGGMHDHVEVPEVVADGIEKRRYGLFVGDICLECRAAPSLLLDRADRRAGGVDVAGVSDGDIKSVGGQPGGDNPPHAVGSSGHQGGPCVGHLPGVLSARCRVLSCGRP